MVLSGIFREHPRDTHSENQERDEDRSQKDHQPEADGKVSSSPNTVISDPNTVFLSKFICAFFKMMDTCQILVKTDCGDSMYTEHRFPVQVVNHVHGNRLQGIELSGVWLQA